MLSGEELNENFLGDFDVGSWIAVSLKYKHNSVILNKPLLKYYLVSFGPIRQSYFFENLKDI